MTLLITAICLGIVLGLVGGMLPGLGNVTTLLILFPLLSQWPPEVTIIFYAVLIQCSNFTSSVSALNMGLLGDVTSEPALRERFYIVKNKLVDHALKYSALGSVVAVSITLLLLSYLINLFEAAPFALRTETRFVFVWIVMIAILWWPKNGMILNFVLMASGVLLGSIGHHHIFLGFNDVHILTFGFTEVYAGIPLIAVLGAFLALPSLITILKSISEKSFFTVEKKNNNAIGFGWASSLRGTFLGMFMGMIPLVGTMISSNIAWAVENLFKKNKSQDQQSLNRLLSAESANNSSAITVLIPLLILGLAIVPSEMLLLNIIETLGWYPSDVSMDFYYKIYGALIVACLISYLFCYTFVIPFTRLFYKNFKLLTYITMFIIIVSVYYSGYMVDNRVFFLICFSAFATIVLLTYKYLDYIPLVAGYLFSSEVLHTTQIMHDLYF